MKHIKARPWARALPHAVAGTLVVTSLASGPATANTGGYQPSFEVVSCDEQQFAGRVPAGADAECGLLNVPEDRTLPMAEGNVVVLPVVVFQATTVSPQPDPVVLLAGGPGGSGIDQYAHSGAGLSGWVQALNEQRDVILLDTRGTGTAQPSLACRDDELDTNGSLAALYLQFETTDDPVTERALLDQAYADCAASRRAAGVDLDQYDTPTVARDLGDLRQALGISRWNVYGVSAGTTVALELLRQQPGGQRSVMLDSTYPAFTAIDPASVVAMRKASLRAVIEAAGLEVEAVESSLAAIQARYDPDTGTPYPATDPFIGDRLDQLQLTGDDAVWMLWFTTWIPDLTPLLGLFVANLQHYDVATGQPAALSLEPIFGPGIETFFDFFLSWMYPGLKNLDSADGHWIAVECADRAQLSDPADYAAVMQDEPIYGATLLTLPTFPNVCQQVDVDPVPDRTYRIHQTGVPSLMLAGSLDTLRTPPTVQKQVSDKLGPWSQYVEVPRAAHAVARDTATDPASLCAGQMITSFIETPRQPVDTSCIGD